MFDAGNKMPVRGLAGMTDLAAIDPGSFMIEAAGQATDDRDTAQLQQGYSSRTGTQRPGLYF